MGCVDIIKKDATVASTVEKVLDAKAMEAIFRHLTPYALNLVRDATRAKEAWAILKRHYENKSPANQLHLFDKLLKLKMETRDDIVAHFSKYDSIINELWASGVTAINDKQFLSAVLLRSMGPEFATAVTAVAITAKENLQMETVKANL